MVNAFDEAGAARCRVADDGTVRGPLVPGESYEYYPYEPELVEIDPRTLAAGATIDLNLNSLSSVAEAMDAASAVTRGSPVLGTILGLTIGMATRPEDESLGEALAVEGAGVAAGAAAGAAAGSLVPGPGTALGFLAGAGASILAGPVATAGLRNHIERERADGKEGFRW